MWCFRLITMEPAEMAAHLCAQGQNKSDLAFGRLDHMIYAVQRSEHKEV